MFPSGGAFNLQRREEVSGGAERSSDVRGRSRGGEEECVRRGEESLSENRIKGQVEPNQTGLRRSLYEREQKVVPVSR